MRLTDTIKTIEITMRTWDGLNYSPDFAVDFFAAPYSADLDAYVVDDVDYCIEQAEDWKYNRGDFSGTEDDPDDKFVFFEVLSE